MPDPGNPSSWEDIAWSAYCREPDYRLAAEMVLCLRRARKSGRDDCYEPIAFAGLKSRLLARGQKVATS